MSQMTVRDFIAKWQHAEIKEQAVTQEHFIDICHLVDHPTPDSPDSQGGSFTFERAAQGLQRADVWKRGAFAWEYTGPDQDFDAAYHQLLQYRESLGNPRLLVVSDYRRFRIYTNFQNTAQRVYQFAVDELTQPGVYHYLHAVFHDPESLRPDEHADDVTKEAAEIFAALADSLRRDYAARPVAHFLAQTAFCLFAEDTGLLPHGVSRHGLFTELVRNTQGDRHHHFPGFARQLFEAMATGGEVQYWPIAQFNGGLFKSDHEDFVPDLTAEQLALLMDASQLDWSSIRPSIFGSLFERALDPDQYALVGARYTSREDVESIVEPVLMAPLRREWAAIQQNLDGDVVSERGLPTLRGSFLQKLGRCRVLDPACGSGSFLYVALDLLKGLEKEVVTYEGFAGLPPVEPRYVTPRQFYGIEPNAYAHELARVVVWVGYIQWFRNNGYDYAQRPVLRKFDNIECKDALLGQREDGTYFQAYWPESQVIIGRPPLLDGETMRAELGDSYVDALFEYYESDVPPEAGLAMYWFENARRQIESQQAKRAGLVAAQALRDEANQTVLQAIKRSGDIFFAESDRAWILDGQPARVSVVGFDNGDEKILTLDGESVDNINPDLTAGIGLGQARRLAENANIAYMGITRGGPFDLSLEAATDMLLAPLNPNNKPNSDVIRPWVNASDIMGRSRNCWIIDFGIDTTEEEAAQYELPFAYVKEHVKPKRDKSKTTRPEWWLHDRPQPELRDALSGLQRYIVTPSVSRYRVFDWVDANVVPEKLLYAFARADDYFFGVLQSKVHEVWALHMGTPLRDASRGNRYTTTTTFETFPFPWPPGQESTDDSRYLAIADAAVDLYQQRDAWLNPPGAEVATLKDRTLASLYNDLQDGKVTWLALLHEKLDRAVFAAYGWDYDEFVSEEYGVDEVKILCRLLALNLERAAEE